MNWSDQAYFLLILVLLLAAVSMAGTRASRLCRVMAVGNSCGAVLGAAGFVGLIEVLDRQGAGSLSWVPESIIFGWPGDLMAGMFHYAPLAGALSGAVCAWWVSYLRRPRSTEVS